MKDKYCFQVFYFNLIIGNYFFASAAVDMISHYWILGSHGSNYEQ
jgi:hypothetical protein